MAKVREVQPMNVQQRNKENFKTLIDEVITAGRLEMADHLLTADRPDDQAWGVPPEMLRGYEGFKWIVSMIRAAFPDLRYTSEYMIAEDDRVLSYNRIEGTHRGPFMGIPPTGRTFRVDSADICQFNDQGKISAHWGVFDTFSMMVQLGVVPQPGQPSIAGA
jgi:predicted ester cyclase